MTAGTLMHRTRLPLLYWFVAATQLSEECMSSRALAELFGVHVETAWQLAQRLRIALPEDKVRLDGVVNALVAVLRCRPARGARGSDPLTIVVAVEEASAEAPPPGGVARGIVVPSTYRRSVFDLAERVTGEVTAIGPTLHRIIQCAAPIDRQSRRLPVNSRTERRYCELSAQNKPVEREDTGLPYRALPATSCAALRRCSNLRRSIGAAHGSVSRAWADGYLREFVARTRCGGDSMRRALLAHALRSGPLRFDDLVRAMRQRAW